MPEAVEALRAARKSGSTQSGAEIKLSACDPLDLAGILLPGPRVPAVPTNFLVLRDGAVVRTVMGRQGDMTVASLTSVTSPVAQPCV